MSHLGTVCICETHDMGIAAPPVKGEGEKNIQSASPKTNSTHLWRGGQFNCKTYDRFCKDVIPCLEKSKCTVSSREIIPESLVLLFAFLHLHIALILSSLSLSSILLYLLHLRGAELAECCKSQFHRLRIYQARGKDVDGEGATLP